MRSLWRRLFVLLAAPVAIAIVPACAENKGSLFIKGVAAAPPTRTGSACVFTGTETALLSSGTLDVGISDGYVGALALESQLITREDRLNLRVESANFIVDGAVVTVTDLGGNELAAFTSLSKAYVAASGTGVLVTNLTDSTVSAALRSRLSNRNDRTVVIANVQAFGESTGNKDIESNTYSFPITVCNGCLVDFSVADPAQPDACVPLADTGTPTTTPGPCFNGQDGATPCTACLGRPACDKR